MVHGDQSNKGGNGESERGDANGERYTVNPHYHELLVTHAAKSVIDEIEDRNNRTRNLIITGMSAVIALLVTAGGFLINELLDVRIEARVESALERELAQARLGVEAARLTFRAGAIDLRKETDRRMAVDAIEKLELWHSDYVASDQVDAAERIANEAMIAEPARLLLDNFSKASRLDLSLRLYNGLPEVFADDPDGSFLFAGLLSDAVLSAPDAPQAWLSEDGDQHANYLILKDQMRRLGYRTYPEAAIATNAMLAYLEDPSDVEGVKTFLAQHDGLDENDQEYFYTIMDNMLTGGYRYALDKREGRLVRDRTEAMLAAVCPFHVVAQYCEDANAEGEE